MFIVCLIFASLGILGSVFVAAMFVLNLREIDKRAIDDAERFRVTRHGRREQRRPL